jgi:hypothetical protein
MLVERVRGVVSMWRGRGTRLKDAAGAMMRRERPRRMAVGWAASARVPTEWEFG